MQIRKEREAKTTLCETNIAMENAPFEDVFPIGKGGFSIVMLVYRSANVLNFEVVCPQCFITSQKLQVFFLQLPILSFPSTIQWRQHRHGTDWNLVCLKMVWRPQNQPWL